jgi:hypothetical protein
MNLRDNRVTELIKERVDFSYESEKDSLCGFADHPESIELTRAFESLDHVSTAKCSGLENIFSKVQFICNKMGRFAILVQ